MGQQEITVMLNRLKNNEDNLVDAIYPLIYDNIRKEAHYQLKNERAGHTLQTTALAHEAYLRMVDQDAANYKNRAHFIAIASLAMRRILIDYARKKKAEKRGGKDHALTFQDGMAQYEAPLSDILDLDKLLQKLEMMNERQAKIVQYRFFGGLTYKEIAEVVGGTEHSVRYDWRVARAWLKKEMSEH